MKNIVVMCVFFLSWSHAAMADISSDLVAVVARFVEIRELADPCAADDRKPGDGTECISLDSRFEVKYEVLKTLYGEPKSMILTFDVVDHTGYPDFARYKEALLFVQQHPGGFYLEQYQGFPVHQTVNGRWAMCGLPYHDNADVVEGRIKLASVDFGPSVVFGDVTIYNEKTVQYEYDLEYMQIVNNKVYCTKGVYVEDLFNFVRDGVLKDRGIFLAK